MKRGSVRIERIEIQNFKNVKKGQITLKNNRKKYKFFLYKCQINYCIKKEKCNV